MFMMGVTARPPLTSNGPIPLEFPWSLGFLMGHGNSDGPLHRVSKSCDRTVAQNFLEIAQDLGFWTQEWTIYKVFTFFGSFFYFFMIWTILANPTNKPNITDQRSGVSLCSLKYFSVQYLNTQDSPLYWTHLWSATIWNTWCAHAFWVWA